MRGLCSEEEVDILIKWINDEEDSSGWHSLAAAKALCALIRRPEYTSSFLSLLLRPLLLLHVTTSHLSFISTLLFFSSTFFVFFVNKKFTYLIFGIWRVVRSLQFRVDNYVNESLQKQMVVLHVSWNSEYVVC